MICVGCSGFEDCAPRFLYGGCATIIGIYGSKTRTLTGEVCDFLPVKDTIFFRQLLAVMVFAIDFLYVEYVHYPSRHSKCES